MKGNSKKILIWFLVVIIAFGYNFAIRLPKDEKSQIIKITPKQESFKVSENPKFTLEIEHSKSLRRFFRLVLLPWPVARAEEKVDFTEEISLGDGCDADQLANCHSERSEESRGNAVTREDDSGQPAASSEILPRQEADQDDRGSVLGEFATTTEEMLNLAFAETSAGEQVQKETKFPFWKLGFLDENNSSTATTFATTTDDSLLDQALEKVGDLMEQVKNAAQEFLNEEKTIEVTVSDPAGKEVLETSLVSDQERIEIELPKPEEDFQPGKWKLEVEVKTEKLTLSQSLEFPWGVLAINTNKSIYLSNEQIYLQLAALDDQGHTLCDAQLQLEIKNPQSETQIFSTEAGTIEKSSECGPTTVTNKPDYFAYYQVGQTGTYQMKLTNLTNGYEIEDSFEVRESAPFEVEGSGPTRIYPPASYEMALRIKVNQDFEGQVVEQVPDSFEILNPKSEILNKFQIQNSNNPNTKEIIWQVDWKAGESYELSYQFDAPDVSPQLYLLGPLQLMETKFPTGNLVSLIFQEARSWQIAADEGFKVSMAIRAKDENGAGAKQGDIIAIKPAGSEWSKAVKINHIILEVDLGNSITTWEDAQKLTVPIFETGELWWPEEDPKIIGDRRYQINFDDLEKKAKDKGITFDFSKIVDLKDKANFQRLEKITLTFDNLIQDKVSNKKLKSADLKIIKDVGK